MRETPSRYIYNVWRLSRRAILWRLLFLTGNTDVSHRVVIHANEIEYLLGRMTRDATTTLIW